MPAAALGTSGRITLAEANTAWTQAHIAGTVEWSKCDHGIGGQSEPGSPPPPPCEWTPYATVGPGTPAADCSSPGREWPDLSNGVSLAWFGGARSGSGAATAGFDVPDLALSGEPGQLLCLSLLEVAFTGKTIPCAPPGEPIPPGWHCPYVYEYVQHQLASAFLMPVLEGSSPAEAWEEALAESSPSPIVSSPGDVVQRRSRRRCRHRRHHAAGCHRNGLHRHAALN